MTSDLVGNEQQLFVNDSFIKACNLGEKMGSIYQRKEIKYWDLKAAPMPI